MSKEPLQRRTARLLDYLVIAHALSDEERQQIRALGSDPDPETLALGLYDGSPLHWTAEAGEDILAVGGYVQTGAITYRSYFLYHPDVFTHYGKEITQMTKEVIDAMCAHHERLRLETWCLESAPKKTTDWYQALGLTHEATLRGYGADGESVWLFSKVHPGF